MSVTRGSAGDLKKGSYVILDDEPCEVLEVSKSKPGKHGSAKVRVEARGIFDGARRSKIFPADALVEIPIVDKKTAQVINVYGNVVQLMDLETYETFELPLPEDPELASKLKSGIEVEYWESMGKRKIVRTRGGV
ncbi:MAG: translation initiation factor IF-5A [Candidatus Korarchaeum sp.]|jgi:translation initiation factor 5A|nr:translation initiation factor IF-5A [Candidatus Korarchaeum sp.]